MRGFYSQHAYQKYCPYQTKRRRFLSWLKKRKQRKNKLSITTNPKFKPNPFKKRKKRLKRKLSLTFKIIFLLIIALSWFILLLYLPFFRINRINYSGLENIKKIELDTYLNEQILKPASHLLPLNNYFIVNEAKINKKLKNNFPIQTIVVKKIFPNKLKIKIKEKTSSLIYDNGKNYFLMDDNGSIIKYLTKIEEDEFISRTIKIPTSTTSTPKLKTKNSTITTSTIITIHIPNYKRIKQNFGNYPVLYDRRNKQVKLNDNKIIPNNYITAILSINEEINKGGLAKVKYFILDSIGSGIQVETTNSWNIYFQPDNNLNSQLNNLKLILKDNKPWNYVDLRYGSRVYWK